MKNKYLQLPYILTIYLFIGITVVYGNEQSIHPYANGDGHTLVMILDIQDSPTYQHRKIILSSVQTVHLTYHRQVRQHILITLPYRKALEACNPHCP